MLLLLLHRLLLHWLFSLLLRWRNWWTTVCLLLAGAALLRCPWGSRCRCCVPAAALPATGATLSGVCCSLQYRPEGTVCHAGHVAQRGSHHSVRSAAGRHREHHQCCHQLHGEPDGGACKAPQGQDGHGRIVGVARQSHCVHDEAAAGAGTRWIEREVCVSALQLQWRRATATPEHTASLLTPRAHLTIQKYAFCSPYLAVPAARGMVSSVRAAVIAINCRQAWAGQGRAGQGRAEAGTCGVGPSVERRAAAYGAAAARPGPPELRCCCPLARTLGGWFSNDRPLQSSAK